MPEMESTDSQLPKTSKFFEIGSLATDIGPMLCQTSDVVTWKIYKNTECQSRLVNLLYNIMSGKESVLTCLHVFRATVINFQYNKTHWPADSVGSRSFEINSGDLQHQTVGLLSRQD